jgi:tRNA modification GTPase
VIEVHLDLGGYPLTLLDTAGIRDSDEPVEQEGVRRARERAAAADLVLWVVDVSANDGAVIERPENFERSKTWLIENKIDIGSEKARAEPVKYKTEFEFNVRISAKAGEGISELVEALGEFAAQYFAATESVLITRGRHRQALAQTVAALDRALGQEAGSEELIAEELRLAATTLGRLIGRVDVEDILDVIFRDFCIGK